MRLRSLELLFRTEARSRLYLVQKCWRGKKRFCIRCGSRKLYRLGEKRYRCALCRYTFQDFSGRWVGQLTVTAKKWLWILKLFELETTTRGIASEAEISYPTALKAAHLVRCSIIQAADGDDIFQELSWSESCFGRERRGTSRGKNDPKTPVFGLTEREGKVKITIVDDITPEFLLSRNIKAAKTGSIVYTERWKDFDALMFGGYRELGVQQARRMTRTRVSIDSQEGFWSFAKERLIKFHGVSQQHFPLYIKEMEFRYNNRRHELYDLLADSVTRLMPKN
jgi:transposase